MSPRPRGLRPPCEAIITILPCSRAFMCSFTASVVLVSPCTLTAKVMSQSCFEKSTRSEKPGPPITPACGTQISIPPNSEIVRPAKCSSEPGSVTSTAPAIAFPPFALIASAVSCAAPPSRSHTATAAPRLTSTPAIPTPIPRPAPVIIATLFSSCPAIVLAIFSVLPECLFPVFLIVVGK